MWLEKNIIKQWSAREIIVLEKVLEKYDFDVNPKICKEIQRDLMGTGYGRDFKDIFSKANAVKAVHDRLGDIEVDEINDRIVKKTEEPSERDNLTPPHLRITEFLPREGGFARREEEKINNGENNNILGL